MSIELPPLPELLRVYTIDGAKYVDGGAFADWFGIQVERERILLDRIAELERLLSDCVEHMEHSTPEGQAAWHAAHRAIYFERKANP